jgi:hypothetical protein
MARAAIGSAQDQPNAALRTRPASNTADRYVHSIVWVESAMTVAEPSSRPVRRLAHTSSGITINDAIARPIPTGLGSASPAPSRKRIESTLTHAARAKNDTPMNRSASRSRPSGIRDRNCQMMTAALDTSTNESSPNPISADDDAIAPAAIATMPSIVV